MEFLRAVERRTQQETADERRDETGDAGGGEPLFDLIHGVPGAGKSKLIGWLRRFFEEVFGWKHGVQFVCLAFQNIMAALISGFTVHHWACIAIGEAEGTSTTKDANRLSTRCQCLRFIIIDEISMISAQLLAQLEVLVARVVRRRAIYRCRADGTSRPFGGINMLLFGDLWQLKPVTGTELFSNPDDARTGTAAHGLGLLWGAPPNAVHRTWDFQTSLRCTDPWYNVFLKQCRFGELRPNVYELLHGFPTAAPVALLDAAMGVPHSGEACTCRSSDADHAVWREGEYFKPWTLRFLHEGATPEEIMQSECPSCAATRKARTRVLFRNADFVGLWSSNDLGSGAEDTFKKPPFDTALSLYAFNVPRYYTVMLRAREFARVHERRLRWCVARDVPLHRDDRDLSAEALDAKRSRWLQKHDQHTAHLASSLPLVRGLPVRITETVDRGRHLFRGVRGKIYGWVAHPEETSEEIDGLWFLDRLPLVVCVEFPDATWTIEGLPRGV